MPTLLSRAAALLGVEELARFEEPQLVRYRPGQCFNWHYDAVPPTLLGNGGQRVATLLVYLNDVHDGGCTAFRDLRAGGTDAQRALERVNALCRWLRDRGEPCAGLGRHLCRRGHGAARRSPLWVECGEELGTVRGLRGDEAL